VKFIKAYLLSEIVMGGWAISLKHRLLLECMGTLQKSWVSLATWWSASYWQTARSEMECISWRSA